MQGKVLICPDSFKGTMTSVEAAETIESAVREVFPSAETQILPIADGGEGTLECMRRATAGSMLGVMTRDSNFRPINAEFYLTRAGAVIESAKVIGLNITEDKNPLKTTTYGVGLVAAEALKHTNRLILTLGGSSTNDGGCGIAAALGAKFLDKDGKSFIPTGATLKDISKIDASGLPKIEMSCMCDVKNPLYGENGAAYIFAPQKGADPPAVKELDDGLRNLAAVISECLEIDVSQIEGGGAAGGIAAGMVAFFGAKLLSGIEVMLNVVHFDELLEGTKLIITGEGRLDTQTLTGKAIDGIIKRATPHGIPVIAICGQIELGFDLEKSGLALAIATGRYGEVLDPTHDYKINLHETTVDFLKRLN